MDDFAPTGYYNNIKVKTFYTSSPGVNPYPFHDASGPFFSVGEHSLATMGADGQPDKFSYQLLNKSGSFYIQKDDAGNVSGFVPVPFDNIRIEFNNGRFMITDTDGTVYQFGDYAGSHVDYRDQVGMEYTQGTDFMGQSIMTTWKCKKIESATKTSQIDFEYMVKPGASFKVANDYIEYYHSIQHGFSSGTISDCGADFISGDESPASLYSDYSTLLAHSSFHILSSPKYMEYFGGGLANFHLPYFDDNLGQVMDKVYTVSSVPGQSASSVLGVALKKITFRGGSVEFVGVDYLSSVLVRDNTNALVKNITLNHSLATPVYTQAAKYYNGNNYDGTAYLDSVRIDGSDIYRFVYKHKTSFGNHLTGHDAWGYRNSQTTEAAGYSMNGANNVPRQSNLIQEHMARFPSDGGGGAGGIAGGDAVLSIWVDHGEDQHQGY